VTTIRIPFFSYILAIVSGAVASGEMSWPLKFALLMYHIFKVKSITEIKYAFRLVRMQQPVHTAHFKVFILNNTAGTWTGSTGIVSVKDPLTKKANVHRRSFTRLYSNSGASAHRTPWQ
jgi:hypothetical protein